MSGEIPEKNAQSICVNIDADRLIIYATRRSIKQIISALDKLAKSDEKDADEINIIGMFTEVYDVGTLLAPPIIMGDGLGEIFEKIRKADLESDIRAGILPANACLVPFEISIMHVSEQAVKEEAARR